MKKDAIVEEVGKVRKDILEYLKDFFKKNARHYKIEMAFLYGSWAGGFQKKDSDVDIAAVFLKELNNDDEIFEYLTNISLLLSRKLHCEVNLLHINSDFRYPMLYYNAIVLGIPVFIKDFSEYIDLKNEAIFQMEDFNIFCRGWQMSIAKQNMEALIHD